MALLALTVTADVVCPFSYLGCARLFEALLLEEISPAALVWSFEPVMISPPIGEPSIGAEQTSARYGDPTVLVRRVEKLIEVASSGAKGVAPRSNVSSLRAHALLARFPDPELLKALFEAHFQNGRDVSSMGDLIEIAATRGITRSAVVELLENPEHGADVRARAERHADLQTPRIRISGSAPFVGVHHVDTYRRALAHGRA